MINIKRTTHMCELVFSNTECPFCGEKIVFYDISPVYCKGCPEIMPNFMDLIENINDRIEYHKKGLLGIT